MDLLKENNMEQNNKPISRWMQWYNNGGREKVLARRRAQGYLSKKEYLELTKQK